MSIIGLDLGGTKLAGAFFDKKGTILTKEVVKLSNRKGKEVSAVIINQISNMLDFARQKNIQVKAIGLSVPGIYFPETRRVWANNIPGWDNYPLYDEISNAIPDQKIKISIDNDRACSVLGEVWMGKARNCKNVIFLLVGTGIGAGILANGEIISGHTGAAGAIGWLALDRPFSSKYISCGCFEYYASGNGIAKVAGEYIKADKSYKGILKSKSPEKITSIDVFNASDEEDPLAQKIIRQAIEFWGMAVANLISLFNPEKIILGGGIFGPALKLVNEILTEARKWAQPVSINHVQLEGSALGTDAALYGAGFLALKNF